MTKQSEILEVAGRNLFGPQWQSPLARELDVADRTVRRWAAGQAIPPGVWAALVVLLEGRRMMIASTLNAIRNMEPDQ